MDRAGVHEPSTLRHEGLCRLGVEGLGECELAEERGAPVHVAQTQEVGREAAKAGLEGSDERVFVVDAQQWIGGELVADRAGGRLSRCGGAEGARTVRGPERSGPGKPTESLDAAELLA